MKMCPCCGVVYDTTHFYKDNQKKDKLYSICKSCYKQRYLLKKEKVIQIATDVVEHNIAQAMIIIGVVLLVAVIAVKAL